MVLATVLAVGGAFAAGTPAHAAGPGGGQIAYFWIPCQGSTGQLLGLTGSALAHTFVPCHTPLSHEVYGVATYDGTRARGFVVWLPAQGGGEIWTVDVPVGTATQAVCLLDAPDHRLACAEVVPAAGGGVTLGAALPVDSPLVSMVATFPPADREPPVGPNCLSCPG